MIRLAVAFSLLAAPALAADHTPLDIKPNGKNEITCDYSKTFTKEEVQAAYSMGRADASREAVAASPAGQSLIKKTAPPKDDKASLTTPKASK